LKAASNASDERHINLTEPFRVGEWQVDPSSRRLVSGTQDVKLEPKVMKVLLCLVQHPGQVISRETLEDTVWAGTVVGYDALPAAIIKLRKSLNDDAFHPRYIETVSKTGYRLIAEVTPSAAPDPVPQVAEPVNSRSTRSRPLVYASLIIGLSVLVLLSWWLTRPESGMDTGHVQFVPPKDKMSIAVLPLANIGGNAEQDYFSDGITEDITTELSRMPNLFVISRYSTLRYKKQNPDPLKIGHELGVRYILDGSVQRNGQDVRITINLTDTRTQQQVWAERHQGTLDDIFSLQDEITRSVIHAMSIQIDKKTRAQISVRHTENSNAYDVFLKGWQSYQRQQPADFRMAIDYFNQALELDPNYARAQAALAATYWQITKRYWHVYIGLRRWQESWAKAEYYLKFAMRKPTPLAYQVTAEMHAQARRYAQAIDAAEKGIALDSNDADGHVVFAGVLSLAGEPERAAQQMKIAMRLNPYYPPYYLYYLGLVDFSRGQYEQAQTALQHATELNPEDRWSYRLLIAVYGHLGSKKDAAQAVEKLKNLDQRGVQDFIDPLTIRSTLYWLPFKSKSDAERLARGLRLANIPD